jgi:cytidylate kinase
MTAPSFIIIAIDGGAASGKSSTARALSERFNLLHVDTGSFYRGVTHLLLEVGVSADDEAKVAKSLRAFDPGTRINGRSAQMEIGDWTPGDELRRAEVNENVSKFAALPVVRKFLFDYQRDQESVARENGFNGLVMEGRDIGSVIFPDADLRLFLEASPDARAERRAAEGHDDQIHERDKLDKQRKASPLVCPPGATSIDSTNLTLEEVVEKVARLVDKKVGRVY